MANFAFYILLLLAVAVSSDSASLADEDYFDRDSRLEMNFRRPSRVSGDLFQQLEALNRLVHQAQQHGCRNDGQDCSWNPNDGMECCHRHICRCNLFGSNCRCEMRLGK